MRAAFIIVALLAASAALIYFKPVRALQEVNVTTVIDPDDYDPERTLTLVDYIDDFIDIPPGGVDWKMLGATGEKENSHTDETGFSYTYAQPIFADDVRALHNTEVTLKGFMFPLEGDEEQKLFLIGPFPISCPFHYHVGPALVVEVRADDRPVKFTYDPITIRGRMELIDDDPEFSTFYRIHDAREVK